MTGFIHSLSNVKPATYYVGQEFPDPVGKDRSCRMFVVPRWTGEGTKLAEFILRRNEDDPRRWDIGGEGYIVSDPDSLDRHKQNAKRVFGAVKVIYTFCDREGNRIISSTDPEEVLRRARKGRAS